MATFLTSADAGCAAQVDDPRPTPARWRHGAARAARVPAQRTVPLEMRRVARVAVKVRREDSDNERRHPGRRAGHPALAADQDHQQAPAAGLRQADDLLPDPVPGDAGIQDIMLVTGGNDAGRLPAAARQRRGIRPEGAALPPIPSTP